MTIDTIKHLGVEFHRAADSLADTLARLDNARLERLTFLRRRSKDGTARLATFKEEIRTLPEQIAKWDAEAARLESQTTEDLLRQALELAQEKPEPYRAGLPPERLRKVWAEWEDEEGDILKFSQDGQEFDWIRVGIAQFSPADVRWEPVKELDSAERFRPHGATWAQVEAMADEAEKKPAPTLLDLTKLPPGTEVQLMEACNTSGGYRLALGQKVKIAGVGITENDGSTWVISALVPARVVKEGGGQ